MFDSKRYFYNRLNSVKILGASPYKFGQRLNWGGHFFRGKHASLLHKESTLKFLGINILTFSKLDFFNIVHNF
jgi:hypothetical protein